MWRILGKYLRAEFLSWFFKTFLKIEKMIIFMGILLLFNWCSGTKAIPKLAQNKEERVAKKNSKFEFKK